MEAVVAKHSWKLFFKEEAGFGNGAVQKPLRIELSNTVFPVRKELSKAVNFN